MLKGVGNETVRQHDVCAILLYFLFYVQRVEDGNITWIMCQFIENEFLDQRTYQVTFFISSYLLPLIVISGLYVLMIMRLWRQGSGVRMSKESQRGRKRVTRLVVVVVVAFASLWLPIQVSSSTGLAHRILDYIYVSQSFAADITFENTGSLYCRFFIYHHSSDRISYHGLHQFLHQSAALCVSLGEFSQGFLQGRC